MLPDAYLSPSSRYDIMMLAQFHDGIISSAVEIIHLTCLSFRADSRGRSLFEKAFSLRIVAATAMSASL